MRESGPDGPSVGRVRCDLTECLARSLKDTWHWDRDGSPHTSSAAGPRKVKGILPWSEEAAETRLPGKQRWLPRSACPFLSVFTKPP